jgi:hypothetical protein
VPAWGVASLSPPRSPRPVLVITGAAATGKSTLGEALAGRTGLVVLDGDVLASGAVAVAGESRDYIAFWRFLLGLATEIHRNDLIPVFTCICRPAQVVAANALDRSRTLHFLALVCDRTELEARIRGRAGDVSSISRLSFHLDFDDALRSDVVAAPDTFTVLDSSGRPPAQTAAEAITWVERLGR